MNSNLQVFCENWESLLKQDPSLKKEQVFLQSELLYELLVPRSRQRYDGVRRNFFGYAEWRHRLDDDIFFNLIEQSEIFVDPDNLINYLSRMLDLLKQGAESFPNMYFLAGP